MSIRYAERVNGAYHDVARLQSLAADDCHVLFVSSRTLYLLANFADKEVNFVGRYVKEYLNGGLIDTVERGDAEEETALEIANRFGLEVIPVCDELTAGIEQISIQLGLINGSIQAAGILDGCCVPVGSNPEEEAPVLGDPDVDDPPDDWVTWAEYNTYKCKAANKIADDWITTLSNLATLSGAAAAIGALALAAFFSTSLLSGILVGLMLLGFSAFTAAAIIIGALVLMVLSGAGLLAYFADLAQDISDTKEDLVCQLFEAQSPAEAKIIVVNFTLAVAALITYDPGDDDALFQAQLSNIVNALFNSSVTNTLFELDEEVDVYVGTVDCDLCETFGPDCEWILAPAGVIGIGSTAATIGTGVITMDGVPFTITATERPEQSGTYGIGMLIRGYWYGAGVEEDNNLPTPVHCVCCVGENDLEGVGGSGTAINFSRGRLCVAGCNTISSNAPFPLVNTFDDYVFCYWQAPGPFTRDFTATIP